MNDYQQMYVDVITYTCLRLYVDYAKVSIMARTKKSITASVAISYLQTTSFYLHCSVPTSAKTNIRPL